MDNTDKFVETVSYQQQKKTSNNLAYMLSAEDPSIKGKVRYYLAIRLNNDNIKYIDITGFELEKEQVEEFKIDGLEGFINSNKKINLWIPWNRVINIKNLNFNK